MIYKIVPGERSPEEYHFLLRDQWVTPCGLWQSVCDGWVMAEKIGTLATAMGGKSCPVRFPGPPLETVIQPMKQIAHNCHTPCCQCTESSFHVSFTQNDTATEASVCLTDLVQALYPYELDLKIQINHNSFLSMYHQTLLNSIWVCTSNISQKYSVDLAVWRQYRIELTLRLKEDDPDMFIPRDMSWALLQPTRVIIKCIASVQVPLPINLCKTKIRSSSWYKCNVHWLSTTNGPWISPASINRLYHGVLWS